MSFYYESDQSVLGRIRARETARAYREQAAGSMTEAFASSLNALYQAYPHLDAGVLVGLARAGVKAGDPIMQQIADVGFEKKRREGFFDKVGDVIGGAAGAVGKPLGMAARGLDTALGGIDEAIAPGAKGSIRTGFVVLESGLQELQTFIRAGGYAGVRLAQDQGDTSALNRLRNIVDPTRWDDYAQTFGEAYPKAGSSSGREVLSAMLRGEDVDLGSGFLPAGEVEEVVRERANRLSLTVGDVQFGGPGNPSITPGRVIAAKVTEPGETQFNILSGLIDGGVAWFGDPAAAVGAVARTARAGTRVGRSARALRSGDLAQAGRELATNPGFVPVVDRSLQGRAAEGLGDLVDSVTGRLSGTRKTVQPDLVDQWLTKGGRPIVERIAEENDFYKLWQETGKQIPVAMTVRLADARTPAEVAEILRPAFGVELRTAPEFLGFKVRKVHAQGVRLAQEMPGAYIDPDDLDQGVEQLDRWLRNARVSPELRNASVEKLARVPNRQAMVSTLGDVMGDVAEDLMGRVKGRGELTAKGRARHLTTLWQGDVDKARTYFVDEIAENRKALGIVVDDAALPVQSPFLFTEFLHSQVPLPDAREVRRATSRLRRWVDTPFFERAVSALDSGQGAWKRLVLLRGAYTVRVVGEEQLRMAASGLDSAFAHPLSFIAGLTSGEGKVTKFLGAAGRRASDVTGEGFVDDVGNPVAELQAAMSRGTWGGWVDTKRVVDPEWRIFAPTDEGYHQAWAEAIGGLRIDPVARKVAEARGNLDDVKDWFFRRQGRKFRKPMVGTHPELATKAGSDAYVNTLWEGVKYRTGGDPVLLDAVATGRIGEAGIGTLSDGGRWSYSRELLAHLEGSIGPAAVKGQRGIATGQRVGALDNATSWAFSYLATKPTNWLSRSQTFKQRYWERIEEMAPYMDDATRSQALHAAAVAKLDRKALDRIAQAKPMTSTPLDDLSEVDYVAKAFALDETKGLLYDLTERSQFFDAFRLIFPFGEAWREVMTRWAKIGAQNPRAIRRGQQLMTGARGSGFFAKDVNGEETFVYPGSRMISKALIGMPIDLKGRVAGLSLMTEVLPGVGPVVQIPAAAILPETPDWDFARRFISPYGAQDYGDGILEAFLPGYARNLMQFFQAGDERLFANAVGSSMDYLASTGDYDLSNADEWRRITDDATNLARKVYLLRGLTQFGAPTSPQPEYLIEDKDGDLEVTRVVLQDFYRLQEEDYESAVGEFLTRYGTDAFLLTQGKSMSIPPTLPVTKASADWERANGDIVKDYGNVWGFFAPKGDTDDFDYQAYLRQFARGDRVTLTPEQRVALAQARVGRHIFEQAKTRVSETPTGAEREWLGMVKDRIRQEYPGYAQMTAGFGGGIPGLPARASDEALIGELARAIEDPRLSSTRQAGAARIYLRARQRALAYATEVGVQTLEAQAAEPARIWLAQVARRILARYPEFQELYETMFAREVES